MLQSVYIRTVNYFRAMSKWGERDIPKRFVFKSKKAKKPTTLKKKILSVSDDLLHHQ
jgi:hypothetical protein